MIVGSISVCKSTNTVISASQFSNVNVVGVGLLNNAASILSTTPIDGGAAIAVTGGSTPTLSGSVIIGNSVRSAGACVGNSACTVAGGAVYADANQRCCRLATAHSRVTQLPLRPLLLCTAVLLLR